MESARFSSAYDKPGEHALTLENSLKAILRDWRFLLAVGLLFGFVAGVIALLIPNQYTASASILPNSAQSANGLMSLSQDIQGIDLGGINLSDKSPSILYPDILKSRTVAEAVLEERFTIARNQGQGEISLYDYFKTKDKDIAYAKLLDMIEIETTKKSGIVKISVTTKNRELSAQVANALVEQLDYFNRYNRRTNASQNAEFIANRMAEVKKELTTAEEQLRDFRQSNMNYYMATDPELLRILGEMQREIDLKNQTYLILSQQYELAVIQEKKELPVVQLLDTARIPTGKSGPARTRTVLTAIILGMTLAAGINLTELKYPQRYNNIFRRKLNFIRRQPEISVQLSDAAAGQIVRDHVENL